MAQLPPINELMRVHRRGDLVAVALRPFFDQVDFDVVDRQDQVVSLQSLLLGKERQELVAALLAREEARSDDRKKERARLDFFREAPTPVLPPLDVVAVDEDRERVTCLRSDLSLQALGDFLNPLALVRRRSASS
jgi:hypothetical protein